ncbi:UNVERIFIED_CONTAM: hypothetical protein PYX00_008351 [Menopon gallinae]|uniref:Aminopeptidase N n=1 Tax=Menopon gallinae TaxID=328185 RepID=A0AAW2HNZ4_9NEOP
MPVRLTEPCPSESGWVWDHFQSTPPMSTFSLAIVISDFQSVSINTTRTRIQRTVLFVVNNSLRIWSRKEIAPSLHTALRIAPKALTEITNYLAMPLPVPKIDIVALPGYTAIPDSNWGLIIFKEGDLTIEEFLVKHLTREIMYQWIGNLVTPHWWSEVHINKALVNFISRVVSLKVDPTLIPNSGIWTKNYPLYYEYGRNQPYKNLPSQKPPKTVTKTELILRMLNWTLSGDTFQKGIQQLIGERQYKTFTQDDVWSSLTEQAGMDGTLPEPATVNQIAESWMKKERLPLVTVKRDYEKNAAEISQTVFIRDLPQEGPPPGEENFTWWIPLVIVQQNNLNFTDMKPAAWMKEEKKINLNNLPPSTYFIIVNPEEIGPFLVNYDPTNWNMIANYLEKYGINEQIPPATRAKLIHDSLNLAYSGKLCFNSALNMTRFLIHEKDPIVWQPAFNMFDHLQRHIDGSETVKKLQSYIKIILRNVYTHLEKMESSLTKSQERMYKSAKSALCNAGYEPCVKEVRAQWRKWMEAEDPNSGVPIHQSNFCWVFKWGTREEWEFGLDRYINFPAGHKQSDKYYLLKTLISCPNDSWNVERLLNYTMLHSNTTLTEGNTRFILSVLSNEIGYTALFNLLADNFDAIKRRYDTKESALWDNIVSAATRNFKTQDGLDMVTELFVERQGEFGSAETIMEQSLKHIKQEVKWNEDNLPTIDQWLDNYLSSQNQGDNKKPPATEG